MEFIDKLLERFFKNEGERKKLVNVVIPSFAVQSFALLLGFATNFIMARGLGASDFGVFTFAFSVVLPFVNLVSFGLGVLMVREMPHILTQNSPGLLKGLHHWSIKLAVPICIVLSIGIALVTYLLPHTIYTKAILIAAAIIPFYGLMNYYNASIKGLHKVVLSQVSDNFVRPLVFLVGLLFVYYFSKSIGVYPLIYLNIIAFAAGMLFASIAFYRTIELKGITPEYDTRKWWGGFGSLSLLNGILSLDAKLDMLMLGFITTSAQVGIFSIAHKIVLTLYFFLSVMNAIIAPGISKMNSLNDKAGMQKMTTKTIRWVMLFSLPAGILIIVFSKWIMLYFGKDFEAGQLSLIILTVAQLFSISCGPVATISVMTGNERYNTIATIMSMAITLLLNLLLTPSMGITGSAIAAAVAIVVWNLYMVYMVKVKVGITSWVYKIN